MGLMLPNAIGVKQILDLNSENRKYQRVLWDCLS